MREKRPVGVLGYRLSLNAVDTSMGEFAKTNSENDRTSKKILAIASRAAYFSRGYLIRYFVECVLQA